jgi:hypothetical protein
MVCFISYLQPEKYRLEVNIKMYAFIFTGIWGVSVLLKTNWKDENGGKCISLE